MLAFDYYIIKESKKNFKSWTKAGLEFLKQHLNNIKDKNEKRRVMSNEVLNWAVKF